MPDKNKNKDVFLQSIGNVKPLKKSDKKFKEIKIVKTHKTKKEKTAIKPATTTPVPNTVKNNTTNDLKIEIPSIGKKFKKGKVKINKKIDFHGLSIDEARQSFINTIDSCFYSNNRCILFVTGKGMKNTTGDTRNVKLFHGRIRENFQRWVFEKEVAGKILRVAPADFAHGGDGAFFVYLRKNKH